MGIQVVAAEVDEAFAPVMRWVNETWAERTAGDWLAITDTLATLVFWGWEVQTTFVTGGELRVRVVRKDGDGVVLIRGSGTGFTLVDALVGLSLTLQRAMASMLSGLGHESDRE